MIPIKPVALCQYMVLVNSFRYGDSPGCLSFGTQLERIVRAPVIKPEAARPAIVLPIINIADVIAAPQMADPISKMTKNVKKVHYIMSDLMIRYERSAAICIPWSCSLCISCPLMAGEPHWNQTSAYEFKTKKDGTHLASGYTLPYHPRSSRA